MKIKALLLALVMASPLHAQQWGYRQQAVLDPRPASITEGDSIQLRGFARTSTGILVVSPGMIFGVSDSSVLGIRKIGPDRMVATAKKAGTVTIHLLWSTKSGQFRDSLTTVVNPLVKLHSRCFSPYAAFLVDPTPNDVPSDVQVHRVVPNDPALGVSRLYSVREGVFGPYCVGIAVQSGNFWRVFITGNNQNNGTQYCPMYISSGYNMLGDYPTAKDAVRALGNYPFPIAPNEPPCQR